MAVNSNGRCFHHLYENLCQVLSTPVPGTNGELQLLCPQTAAPQQAAFNEGELVVLSLETAPRQRPQPAVARAIVAACSAAAVTLTLQRRLRPTLADAPVRRLAAAPLSITTSTYRIFVANCTYYAGHVSGT